MANQKQLVVTVDTTVELTLEELCEAAGISPEFLQELIEYGVIEIPESIPQQRFTLMHLQRVRTTQRLQHDLEVNLAGIALILDLMDEREELRQRLQMLERLL